ncbi:MAG: ribonuclease [Microlunatus sp.]|nr:ribonuclease [Microlunatus sp.]
MSRTLRLVGGAATAVALAVVLALVYLQPGGETEVADSPAAPPSTAPTASRTATSAATPSSLDNLPWVNLADLPREAQRTVALIEAGGPFPYGKDGSTFNNFEGVLPTEPRGYYREYTVPTPGEQTRGARRIVTGDRDRDLFYTADHYDTFARIRR